MQLFSVWLCWQGSVCHSGVSIQRVIFKCVPLRERVLDSALSPNPLRAAASVVWPSTASRKGTPTQQHCNRWLMQFSWNTHTHAGWTCIKYKLQRQRVICRLHSSPSSPGSVWRRRRRGFSRMMRLQADVTEMSLHQILVGTLDCFFFICEVLHECTF